MSDRKEITITKPQWQQWEQLTTANLNALWRIAEQISLQQDKQQETIEVAAADVSKWLSILNATFQAGFEQVAEAIAKIQNPLPPPQPKPLEVKFMFVVKDDETDKNFSVVTGDVTDSEGNVIPAAQVDLAVASTDESVVGVTFDPATKSGSVHFGNLGTATITATASSGDKLLGSGAADFTVTVGDPAAISSVGLSFDGLTEAPPA